MTFQRSEIPTCTKVEGCDAVDVVITPKTKDLGGFDVRRVLPAVERRSVGPFVFFDQMGPAVFPVGEGISVRPHPHIGLSTLTWLFEGEIMHRDSLGYVQAIRPGEVNWMTAGSGIVHSERTPEDLLGRERPLFGLQVWMALPQDLEETDPSFQHVAAADIPTFEKEGIKLSLVAGKAWGMTSPVTVHSETLYADVEAAAGSVLTIPPDHEERAVYPVRDAVEIEGARFEAGTMMVLKPGQSVDVSAPGGAHYVVIGGAPIDGKRHLYWNFVASRQERIEQAKEDWRKGRFANVPGDDEFIPLPD
ncbi:pirin family protein [Parvibaculaceae bacterium PLY_AMNH_Bact1]|nr:pirin family protein [Parvibaculaceae bacterium PLY_AMNH_Bact1]